MHQQQQQPKTNTATITNILGTCCALGGLRLVSCGSRKICTLVLTFKIQMG